MGLDYAHVLSSERHYCEFECGACKRLTSLDSYVTSTCSHPICKSCCTNESRHRDGCPSCRNRVGELISLIEVQPLAYRVLCRVKVACPLRKRHNCSWAGDYKNLQLHVESHRRGVTDRSKISRKSSISKRGSFRKMSSNSCHQSERESESKANVIMNSESAKSDAIDANYGVMCGDSLLGEIGDSARDHDGSGSPSATHDEDVKERKNSSSHQILPVAAVINAFEAMRVSGHSAKTDKSDPLLPKSKATSRRRWSMDFFPGAAKKASNAIPRRRKSSDMVSQSSGSVSRSSNSTGERNDSLRLLQVDAEKHPNPTSQSQQQQGGRRPFHWHQNYETGVDDNNTKVTGRRRILSRGSSARILQKSSSPGADKAPDGEERAQGRVLKEKASREFRAGNYKEAIDIYTQAIEAMSNATKDPGLISSIYSNRAAANLRLSLYTQCMNDCDDALKVDDSNLKAYMRKSWAQVEIGRFEDACTTLAIGFSRVPKSSDLEREIKFTKILSQTMKDVWRFQKKENHLEVLNVTDALEVHKLNKHILLARGGAYLALNDTEKAIEEVNEVFLSDNVNVEALEIRAKARYLDGRLENALMDCQTALGIDSQRKSIDHLYQKVRKVQQLYSDADRTMRNESYKQAANMYGMTIHATEPLSKTTELYRVLYLARAEAHLHASNNIQALANANLVLESDHTYIKAWKTKIKALEALNKFEQLAKDLKEIIEGKGNWGSQHRFLVDAYEVALEYLDDPTDGAPNYYQVIGADSRSSIDDIRKMYRLKARACHPDKFLSASRGEQADAEAQFLLLQESINTLSDENARKSYDQMLGLV